ncbi:MAG: hypothetical protein ACI9N1_002075 [Flavobacteriales bacterium]|jgi:hypothetical protein
MNIIQKVTILSAIGLSALVSSCESEEAESNNSTKEVKKDSVVVDRTEKIENIFFNIPSPLETVNILQKSGATYEIELPLDPKLVDSYTDPIDQAVNMGIYSADLNYASVFGKTNDMYYFLACSEKLGTELGVGKVFSKEVTDRIEYNVEDKDSMQIIISELFWELDAALHEDGRESISALIICGGWLEGIYLSSQLAVLNPANEDIKQRIAEQKYSIENLINLLKSYQLDSDLDDVIASFEDLAILFEQITEEKVAGDNTIDEDGLPIIGQQIKLTMSDELLREITQTISAIRVEYTQ